jgi:hypothetical protein
MDRPRKIGLDSNGFFRTGRRQHGKSSILEDAGDRCQDKRRILHNQNCPQLPQAV